VPLTRSCRTARKGGWATRWTGTASGRPWRPCAWVRSSARALVRFARRHRLTLVEAAPCAVCFGSRMFGGIGANASGPGLGRGITRSPAGTGAASAATVTGEIELWWYRTRPARPLPVRANRMGRDDRTRTTKLTGNGTCGRTASRTTVQSTPTNKDKIPSKADPTPLYRAHARIIA